MGSSTLLLPLAHASGQVQKKIDLKTFDLAEGESENTYPSQMRFQDYYECVLSNVTEILDLCEKLNFVWKRCYLCLVIESPGDKPYINTNHGSMCDICFGQVKNHV